MADVALTEFLPNVLPMVDGCPRATVLNELRNVAIDFCTRTWYDQRTLTGELDGGDQILTLVPPEGFAVVQFVSIKVAGSARPLIAMTRQQMDNLVPAWENDSGTVPSHVIARSATELQVWPAMLSAAPTVAWTAVVALKPARDGNQVAEALYEHCYDTLVAGALARLLRMPGKPWTDLKQAGISAEQYVSGMNEHKVHVIEQFSSARTFVDRPTFGVS